MGPFDRPGGRTDSDSFIEGQLLSLYTQLFCADFGMTKNEAREMVLSAIVVCKKIGEQAGTAHLGPGHGSAIRRAAEEGDQNALQFVGVAIDEGATLDDIEEFWNLHDVQRRMVTWSEKLFRTAAMEAFVADGHSEEEANIKVRMMYPMYGDPRDTSIATGANRPLPPALRARVDRYREIHGAEAIAQRARHYSSYNAFVRAEIETGRL